MKLWAVKQKCGNNDSILGVFKQKESAIKHIQDNLPNYTDFFKNDGDRKIYINYPHKQQGKKYAMIVRHIEQISTEFVYNAQV